MVDTKKVGVFIAQCRREHNWTQKELGEKLGVTDKAVSKWENRTRRLQKRNRTSAAPVYWRKTSERISNRNLSSGSGNDYIGRHWLRHLGYSYFMEDRPGTHKVDFACSSPDHFWCHGILRPQSAWKKLP